MNTVALALWFLVAGPLLGPTDASPKSAAGKADRAPCAFPLDSVQIEVRTRSPNGSRRTWIGGSGEATITVTGPGGDAETTHATLDREDMVDLILRFYHAGFFEMRTEYSSLPSVHIEGTDARVSAARPSDASEVRVCFASGSFKKCVSSTVGAPRALERLASVVHLAAQPATVAEKAHRERTYRTLNPAVAIAIESARDVTAYKLGAIAASNYKDTPEKLGRGVFVSYPILEAGVKLNRAQIDRLVAMIADPEAHRWYVTRGSGGADVGFRIHGAENTIDVLVDFAEGLWLFEWVDDAGTRQRAASYFKAVQSDLYALAIELYPEPEFGTAPPKWVRPRRPARRSRDAPPESPTEFALRDVQVEIVERNRLWTRTIWIGGMGKVTVTERKASGAVRTIRGRADPARVIRLLQKLYRMDFFNMRDRYAHAYTLKIRDGRAQVAPVPRYAVQNIRVCCKIGAYEKCVVSTTGFPGSLGRLVLFAGTVIRR